MVNIISGHLAMRQNVDNSVSGGCVAHSKLSQFAVPIRGTGRAIVSGRLERWSETC